MAAAEYLFVRQSRKERHRSTHGRGSRQPAARPPRPRRCTTPLPSTRLIRKQHVRDSAKRGRQTWDMDALQRREQPASRMVRAGDVIDGAYLLTRQIGKGGMGLVFEARHLLLDEKCAIKVLHRGLAHDRDIVTRFRREAQVARTIGHPGVVATFDVGTTSDGLHYMVMELLRGESLAARVKREGTLGARLAAHVICQVLDALAVAHGKGVIHRDLKPSNIFLLDRSRADELPRVKLVDFGVSKFSSTDGSAPEESLTVTGVCLGTPHYMAPEQALGHTNVDHRIDLYALGVDLYHCLTGRVPHIRSNAVALLYAIVNDAPPAPSTIRSDLPEGLEDVMLKALAANPDERFQTADEMRNALLPFSVC